MRKDEIKLDVSVCVAEIIGAGNMISERKGLADWAELLHERADFLPVVAGDACVICAEGISVQPLRPISSIRRTMHAICELHPPFASFPDLPPLSPDRLLTLHLLFSFPLLFQLFISFLDLLLGRFVRDDSPQRFHVFGWDELILQSAHHQHWRGFGYLFDRLLAWPDLMT